jgi:hypothetical protein
VLVENADAQSKRRKGLNQEESSFRSGETNKAGHTQDEQDDDSNGVVIYSERKIRREH